MFVSDIHRLFRIGRAELKVLDLKESVDYYTNVIGLDIAGENEGRVYLKAWDEFDHHSVILQESDSSGLDHLAFKVETDEELANFEKKIEQFGLTLKRISKGARLTEGEAIRFELSGDDVISDGGMGSVSRTVS